MGIYHRRTPLGRRLCHRVVWQMAPWHTEGRLPNDQGFDEWWGIKDFWDEAGYTAWPLFKESGLPVPMIWEGTKGQPFKPVMPLDLTVRPIVDEKYIIPKTVEFIKRNAAAKKPFFIYVGYSEVHPPVIGNPNFVGKSTKRGGRLPTSSPRWTTASGRFWTPSRKRASTTTPSSSLAATTGVEDLSRNLGEVRTGRGVAISRIRRSREACGCQP